MIEVSVNTFIFIFYYSVVIDEEFKQTALEKHLNNIQIFILERKTSIYLKSKLHSTPLKIKCEYFIDTFAFNTHSSVIGITFFLVCAPIKIIFLSKVLIHSRVNF